MSDATQKNRSNKNRLQRKLDVKDFKLRAIQTIAKAINSDVSAGELLFNFKKTLQEPPLSIQKMMLFERQAEWTCLMQFGVEGNVPEVDSNWFSDSGEDNFITTDDGNKEEFDVMIPVYLEEELIAYVIVGDLEEKTGVSPVIKHMNFIQTLTNLIIVAVRNRRMVEANLRQERVKKELELAAEMQAMLVPNQFPSNEFFDVSAIYRPHQQVGGDYYDFIDIGNDEIMLCMADVSGKGVSAAFLMANFQAYLMALFTYRKLELEEAVSELNNRVMQSAQGEKYITFFVATYNKMSREFKYVNCGHNPPLLMNSNGKTEWLKLGSLGLGMFEEIPQITQGDMVLEANSVLLCYTDGLVELENQELEEFGTERLESMVKKHFYVTMAALNQLIIKELNSFRGDMPYVDDTALLSCRFF